MNTKYFNNDVSFRDGLIKGIFDMRIHECFYFIISCIVLMPASVNAMAQLRKAINEGDIQKVREAFTPCKTLCRMLPFTEKIYINELDEKGYGLLHYSVASNNPELVQVLIDNGADVNRENSKGEIAAHLAAGFCYFKLALQLLDSNPGVAILNRPAVPVLFAKPMTLLHHAVYYGQMGIVQRLIAYGVDVNPLDEKNGDTPLHYAAVKDNNQIAEVLLKASANPNLQNISGNTPLHTAAKCGSVKVVSYLLWHGGAKATVQNNKGRAPLHKCVRMPRNNSSVRKEIAGLLLAFGANITTKDKSGVSCEDLAKRLNRPLR